jgi:hypothetical protein
MDIQRTDKYKKDVAIEGYMSYLNKKFREISFDFILEGDEPKKPIVFIVGLQRSGTTLLMQLLTQCFHFTYPDNIVARFWDAPFIGVVVSKSLQKQLGRETSYDFRSDYSLTSDPFGPHEFGYFWTRYFGFEPTHHLTTEQLDAVDMKGLNRDLFLMEHFGGHPLLFKTVPLSLNCDYLAHIFPMAVFIYIKRDPYYVAQSTYMGRIHRYGDAATWWSLKPTEYRKLLNLPPLEQVAGQIKYSLKRIHECLAVIPETRRTSITYESLCQDPGRVLEEMRSFLGDAVNKRDFKIPESFEVRNKARLDPQEMQVLKRYFGSYEARLSDI